MNELDSLRLMVKNFPGGLDVIALRLGKPAETLRKELSGSQTFKLGLSTAMLISEMCIEANSEQCRAFVNAVASTGGGYIELPVIEMGERPTVQASVGNVIREIADVTTAAFAGTMSDNALKSGRREIAEAIAALQELDGVLVANNAEAKPKADVFPTLRTVSA